MRTELDAAAGGDQRNPAIECPSMTRACHTATTDSRGTVAAGRHPTMCMASEFTGRHRAAPVSADSGQPQFSTQFSTQRGSQQSKARCLSWSLTPIGVTNQSLPPAFQAGHPGSIPVARSKKLEFTRVFQSAVRSPGALCRLLASSGVCSGVFPAQIVSLPRAMLGWGVEGSHLGAVQAVRSTRGLRLTQVSFARGCDAAS